MLEVIRAWGGWRGRLRRREFYWRMLVAVVTFVVLLVFLETAFGRAASLVLYIPLFPVLFSLSLRRLHDRARSGWRLLVLLVPILGPLLVGWWLFISPGTRGDNQYGADPRLQDRDYLQVSIHEPA